MPVMSLQSGTMEALKWTGTDAQPATRNTRWAVTDAGKHRGATVYSCQWGKLTQRGPCCCAWKINSILRGSGLRLKTAIQSHANTELNSSRDAGERAMRRERWAGQARAGIRAPVPSASRTGAPGRLLSETSFGILNQRERRQRSGPTKGRGLRAPQHRFLSANPVSEVPKSVQIVQPGPGAPIHPSPPPARWLFALGITSPQGAQRNQQIPAPELRIPSTTHSHTAGRLGINWRGNVVNSREFFLSASQPVAGDIATWKPPCQYQSSWPGCYIPETELASFGNQLGWGWGVLAEGSTFVGPASCSISGFQKQTAGEPSVLFLGSLLEWCLDGRESGWRVGKGWGLAGD